MNDTKYSELMQCISRCCNVLTVKLYQLIVGSTLRWDSNPRFVSKTWCFAGKKANWFGERYKVKSGFLFYIVKKVGVIPRNRGNSNFCFLCGSRYGDNAAAGAAHTAELGNPIVQLLAIVQIILINKTISCFIKGCSVKGITHWLVKFPSLSGIVIHKRQNQENGFCRLFYIKYNRTTIGAHFDVMYVDYWPMCFVVTKEFFAATKRDNVQKSQLKFVIYDN